MWYYSQNKYAYKEIAQTYKQYKDKKACLPTSLFIIQKHYEIIYFANKIII